MSQNATHAFGKKALFALAAAMLVSSVSAVEHAGIADNFGKQYSVQADVRQANASQAHHGQHAASHLLFWNSVALDATGLDHTPVTAGETRVFGEQFGPHRASRAMAIVHIAMYDAVMSIDGKYKQFAAKFKAKPHASVDAAIAQAAHDALVAMFPSQKPTFDAKLAADLAIIGSSQHNAKEDGIAAGKQAAAAILALRANDGADKRPEPVVGVDYIQGTHAGDWNEDPVSQTPLAVGAFWGQDEKPFVIKSASQFRIPVPPSVGSPAFAAALKEVKALGGDGIHTPTTRTADQTVAGIFWAYDAAPSLCAPPRLYNQVALQVAQQQGTTNLVEMTRLLAVLNTAMADAGLSSWESKWYYHYWRPIGGIRGIPASANNPGVVQDPNFMPLGGQASNLNGPNFTPPFPSYPSGHATFGGTIFQILRAFYGTDNVAFTLKSDEFNGVTKDSTGATRPVVTRSFKSFSQAEEENGQSRIYLGIHWAFDKEQGIALGHNVANYVLKNAFGRADQ